MTSELVTNRIRLTLGIAFALITPPPLALATIVLTDGRSLDPSNFYLLADPFVWEVLLAISATAMLLLGLPAWLLLRLMNAGWRQAAGAGAVVGALATICVGVLFDGRAGFTAPLIAVGAGIGLIAGGGAWRIAYRERRVKGVVSAV